MGHTVLGKTICLDYKTKKRRKAKEDELIIFKNTHEAIIDEETWNNAQRLRKTVRRSPKYGTTSHPFTGLLICSDCGGKLSYREPAEHKEKKYDCEIDCANCAAEVQDAISKINGVQSAKVNFMMQKFTLEAEDERFDEILKEAIRIGKTIEPDFKVMGV